MNVYLRQNLGWSSVRQVFRVTRECTSTDRVTGERRVSREVVYGITSLSRSQANAARLLDLNRNHWTIGHVTGWRENWSGAATRQAACLAAEFSRARPPTALPRKILSLLNRLLRIGICHS